MQTAPQLSLPENLPIDKLDSVAKTERLADQLSQLSTRLHAHADTMKNAELDSMIPKAEHIEKIMRQHEEIVDPKKTRIPA
jgi:hypothetical protein